MFISITQAILRQEIKALSNPYAIWVVYLSVFVILFLENGLLLAAFLPGDSLLILLGILIAKGKLNFCYVLLSLTIASGLGSWMSYIQGKLLNNTKLMNKWITNIPMYYRQKSYKIFNQYGLSALLIGRFITFIRTLLPTIAGISGLSRSRFHTFNWISAILWVAILISIGIVFAKSSLFQSYEKELMLCLTILPMFFLIIGFITFLFVFFHRK